MRLIYAGLVLTYGETKVSGPLRNMLPVDRRAPLHVAMAEWSFNPADLDRLMDRCREYYRQRGWPNLPIEIELTKTDDYYMSAWNWPGLDYIVKFNFMYLTDVSETAAERRPNPGTPARSVGSSQHAGIPFKAHWGKINFMDPIRAGPLQVRPIQAVHLPDISQQLLDRPIRPNDRVRLRVRRPGEGTLQVGRASPWPGQSSWPLDGYNVCNALFLIALGVFQPSWARVRIIVAQSTVFSLTATALTFVTTPPLGPVTPRAGITSSCIVCYGIFLRANTKPYTG